MLLVYTLPNCPACQNLKNRLIKYNVEFSEVVIGEMITRERILSMYPGTRTAPIVVETGGSQPMNENQITQYLNERLLLENG